MTWNLTESKHGKEAPDGVCGCVKRTANRLVAQGADIPDLDSLGSVLKHNCPGINFKVVREEDIKALDDMISVNIKPFKGKTIARTLKCNNMINLRRLRCLTCKPPNYCIHYHLGEMLLVPAVNKSHFRG
ncbi:unnamed protein product [Psylliodes chrysocephalus]|uniref:Uncharacterized protein n=1 Tax=Psylliodes chrysocephalus TaxID=3402493 RepID=A0A9P0D338_9CUCU|nr:unnamed protein product [Psylliodes chrysocephala]